MYDYVFIWNVGENYAPACKFLKVIPLKPKFFSVIALFWVSKDYFDIFFIKLNDSSMQICNNIMVNYERIWNQQKNLLQKFE